MDATLIIIAVLGGLLLFVGIVMGLLAGFVEYYPYSLYFTISIGTVVAIGMYTIHKSHKNHHHKH